MYDKPRAPLTFRTLTVQSPIGLEAPDNGLVGPIHFSTTYTRNEHYAYASEYVYGRADNLTLRQTESYIATLENAHAAMLFGSGMSAAMAVILAFGRPAHILASNEMYYGLKRWFAGIGRFGHSIEFVDTTDLAVLGTAIAHRRPDLIWIESPSNPLWKITDIAAVSRMAHEVGALVAVDSTVATPVFTRPIDHGADIVMHSATKYLNGHSDVSAGVLAVARPSEHWCEIARMRAEQGVSLGSLEAWLLARGMRTLDIRVRAQAKSAALLAERLQDHPAVSAVLYPGLKDHPGHEIARRQMTGGFGGMLSVRMKGGVVAALGAAANVSLWKCATSLGGVESLIEHRASMEGQSPSCPDDLLRLSVGIEDPDDLYADLDRAFQSIPIAPPTAELAVETVQPKRGVGA
jgi:cystathionine gamma-synthase